MQLICKTVGDALTVIATHDDGAVDLTLYGAGAVTLPYAGDLRPEDLNGRPVPDGAVDLAAYSASKRYEVETGGIFVNGAPVATDRGSQAMIANALSYVQASGAASVSYKSPAGFVTLTAEQIKAVGLAVGAHIQACFKAEDDIDAGLHASPATITTLAQVDAAYAGLGQP